MYLLLSFSKGKNAIIEIIIMFYMLYKITLLLDKSSSNITKYHRNGSHKAFCLANDIYFSILFRFSVCNSLINVFSFMCAYDERHFEWIFLFGFRYFVSIFPSDFDMLMISQNHSSEKCNEPNENKYIFCTLSLSLSLDSSSYFISIYLSFSVFSYCNHKIR